MADRLRPKAGLSQPATQHGECLSTACLAVRKDARVVAGQAILHNGLASHCKREPVCQLKLQALPMTWIETLKACESAR